MRAVLALLAVLALPVIPLAEETVRHPAAEAHIARLPAPAVTHHALDLPGRTLRFTATAGAVTLKSADGSPQAEIATIAYTLDGADASRPVVFAFNGGPGFASAFVQLGGFGPWRMPMDAAPSTPPVPVPNGETWLDFADLVFIDPVDTGYSRMLTADEAAHKRLLSVGGDIDSLAEVIRRWLEANGRLAAPKFIAGESYGGFRAPRLARVLQSEFGIGVSGLVMISPMLDAGGRSTAFDPLGWAELLPSLAAAAHPDTDLAAVEAYATGEYLQDQLRVARDPAALERITAHVSALTGLDPTLVRRLRGRVGAPTFLREHEPGRFASRYNATVSDPDAEDANPRFAEPDPITERLAAPFTGAMLEIYGRLDWRPDRLYRLRSDEVGRNWEWGRNPESVTSLRVALALDEHLRVLVVHGLYDLVTPYFASKLLLNSIPDIGAPGRIRLLCLPGGHMVYAGDDSRRALRDAVRELVTTE